MTGIKISVDRLQVGNYVKLPLSWKDHPFLFSSFLIKTQDEIDLIRRLGLKQVIIFPDKSETGPKPVQEVENAPSVAEESLQSLESELNAEKERRIEQLKQYRRGLQRSEKAFERSLSQLRNLMSKLQTRPLTAMKEAQELVDGIVSQLLSTDEMVLHLMSESAEGESIYYHSLNVSILSMLLAKEASFSEEEMKLIGFSALMHDIGMLRVPTQILRKTEPLTKPELNLLKQHPRYGLELLELTKECPTEVKGVVLRHQERLDGSGYPDGLKEAQLDKLTQLVSVVDEYDELCHPQDQSKARVPHAVLSFMFKNRTKQLNKDYIGLLVKQLGIYPPGSVVQLSNGQIGLVMSVNSKRLLYPSVMLYDPSIPRQEAAIIDLEDVGLSIGKVLAPTRLPPPVFEYLNPRTRISFYFEHSNLSGKA
ncbi:HD-GYP domain-containing protein [Pseudaeromonas sharmana]|uniref:HD-GYP domain-containing protein n=1 Tax=Pseudaeromonas sharmana TaxID=328412 RepID=A0ABV8CK22_9GAMM